MRPEHITLSTESGEWPGTVNVSEHLGSDTFLHVDVPGVGLITARSDGEFPVHHGDRVYLTPAADKIHRFDSEGLSQ